MYVLGTVIFALFARGEVQPFNSVTFHQGDSTMMICIINIGEKGIHKQLSSTRVWKNPFYPLHPAPCTLSNLRSKLNLNSNLGCNTILQSFHSGETSESSKYGSVNDGFTDEESAQPSVNSRPRYRKNSDAF